jgi:hypothetical protein
MNAAASMLNSETLAASSAAGKVRAYRVEQGQWLQQTELKPNLVVFEWAAIVSKLLTTGDSRYRIGGMYLEFENVVSPGATVSIPAYDRTRSSAYYQALSSHASRDYLRVPLIATQLLSEGTGLENNQSVFFARSSGVVGVHGKPFSAANNSTVFGASLVVYPNQADASQDMVFSSYYLDPTDQQQKLASSQIGIEWRLTLQ